MLSGYSGGTTAPRLVAGVQAAATSPGEAIVGDAETEAGLSAAQAEELERLNRLFGLNAAS
jgi:hypothetical protein